jgi:glutathione S-transferase
MNTPDLKLYFSPLSCAVATMAALELAGLQYEALAVPMAADGAGDAAFHVLNPRRQVPVLVADGQVLRETGAIFQFLHHLRPQASLLPTAPAGVQRAAEWIGHLGGTVHPAFRLVLRPERWVGAAAEAQGALRAETRKHLEWLLANLEGDLSGRWVLDAPSAVDFYLFVFTRWAGLGRFVVPDRLAAHNARVAAVPAMGRALEREAAAQRPAVP